MEAHVAARLCLLLFLLPLLVLLNAPLPRLCALQVGAVLSRVGLLTQRLRELALLLEPMQLLGRHLGLLVVGNQVAPVVCGRLVLMGC